MGLVSLTKLTLLVLLAQVLPAAANTYIAIDYPAAVVTIVTDVNRLGTMAGLYIDQNGRGHGFTYDGSTFATVDYPGADFSAATGINDAGDLVGYYVDGTSY